MHIHSLYECECLNMMCRSENKNRLKDSRCNLVQHFDISPYFDVSAPDVAISLKMEHLMRFEFTFYLQNLQAVYTILQHPTRRSVLTLKTEKMMQTIIIIAKANHYYYYTKIECCTENNIGNRVVDLYAYNSYCISCITENKYQLSICCHIQIISKLTYTPFQENVQGALHSCLLFTDCSKIKICYEKIHKLFKFHFLPTLQACRVQTKSLIEIFKNSENMSILLIPIHLFQFNSAQQYAIFLKLNNLLSLWEYQELYKYLLYAIDCAAVLFLAD